MGANIGGPQMREELPGHGYVNHGTARNVELAAKVVSTLREKDMWRWRTGLPVYNVKTGKSGVVAGVLSADGSTLPVQPAETAGRARVLKGRRAAWHVADTVPDLVDWQSFGHLFSLFPKEYTEAGKPSVTNRWCTWRVVYGKWMFEYGLPTEDLARALLAAHGCLDYCAKLAV